MDNNHTIDGDNTEDLTVFTVPPKTGDTINGYTLESPLKSGKYCWVFVCHHRSDPEVKFVAKLAVSTEYSKLLNEIHCYKLLGTADGIPPLYFNKCWTVGQEEWEDLDVAMIVIHKFNNTFSKTSCRVTEKTLSLEQLIPIALQQLNVMQYIHSKGLRHMGVKPDNFVMSTDGSQVYIIDFNKSKSYLDANGRHLSYRRKDNKRPKGLQLFHSLNYHNGVRRSRRDDMESLIYCWVYLLKGSLPWSQIRRHETHYKDYVKNVGQCVRQTSVEDVCAGLPTAFTESLQMCRQMGYYEDPNYDRIRHLIANLVNDTNNNNSNNVYNCH